MSFDPNLGRLEAQDGNPSAELDVSKPRSWSTVWQPWQPLRSTTQRSINMLSLKRGAGIDNPSSVIRLQAIELLFGLGSKHAQEWPGIHVVCGHLEDKFGDLLSAEFDVIWRTLGRQRPTEALEGWNWCIAVLQGFQTLPADGNVSMENLYQHMIKDKSAKLTSIEKDSTLLAIFAVLCWTSMLLEPDLTLDQSTESTGNNRRPSFRAKGIGRTDEPTQVPLSQTARRPVAKVFRGLRDTMEDSRYVGTATPATDLGAIHESIVNFFSLYTIGRVRVKWVTDLASHLAFDRQFRTLSVFCLPTFCVSSILRTQEINVLQQIASEILPSNYYTDSFSQDNSSLHREVLLSYRLLFGQSAHSRTLALKLLDQYEKSSGDIDPFLRTICSTSIIQSRFLRSFTKSKIPTELFPSANLDLDNFLIESDTYSPQDDFPHFGSRLIALQQYNLRQQPSRVRDLWRDRRNPLQWYTFWAVLWVGGVTIVLGILQLAASVVQTYFSART